MIGRSKAEWSDTTRAAQDWGHSVMGLMSALLVEECAKIVATTLDSENVSLLQSFYIHS